MFTGHLRFWRSWMTYLPSWNSACKCLNEVDEQKKCFCVIVINMVTMSFFKYSAHTRNCVVAKLLLLSQRTWYGMLEYVRLNLSSCAQSVLEWPHGSFNREDTILFKPFLCCCFRMPEGRLPEVEVWVWTHLCWGLQTEQTWPPMASGSNNKTELNWQHFQPFNQLLLSQPSCKLKPQREAEERL